MPAISASYLEEIDRRYCAWKGLSKPPAPLAGLRGSFSFTISEAAWYIRQHGQRNKDLSTEEASTVAEALLRDRQGPVCMPQDVASVKRLAQLISANATAHCITEFAFSDAFPCQELQGQDRRDSHDVSNPAKRHKPQPAVGAHTLHDATATVQQLGVGQGQVLAGDAGDVSRCSHKATSSMGPGATAGGSSLLENTRPAERGASASSPPAVAAREGRTMQAGVSSRDAEKLHRARQHGTLATASIAEVARDHAVQPVSGSSRLAAAGVGDASGCDSVPGGRGGAAKGGADVFTEAARMSDQGPEEEETGSANGQKDDGEAEVEKKDPYEPGTIVPMLLLNKKSIENLDDVKTAIEYAQNHAEAADYEEGILPLADVMTVKVSKTQLEVNMAELWTAAHKDPRNMRVKRALMTELGYDKYTQTMQDKVWGLWKDYLEDWSATAPGRQFLFVMNQAIEWPGGEVPTHDEAKKMAVAAAEARAASGAAAQQQPKGGTKGMGNLSHNKTCEACGEAGMGNNTKVCRSCQQPLAPVTQQPAACLSLPADYTENVQPQACTFAAIKRQLLDFQQKHGGVAFAVAVMPVQSSRMKAPSEIKLGPEDNKIIAPVICSQDAVAKKELEEHYPDLKLLILRQHTGGVAAGMSGEAVIKLAQTKMSTELRGLLQARANSRSSAAAVAAATDKDCDAPIPDAVLKVVSEETRSTLQEEAISDMFALKSILADSVGQKAMGLKYGEMVKLKLAVEKLGSSA